MLELWLIHVYFFIELCLTCLLIQNKAFEYFLLLTCAYVINALIVAKNVLLIVFEAVHVGILTVLVPKFVEHRRVRLLLLSDVVDHVEVLLAFIPSNLVFLRNTVLNLNPQQPLATHEVNDNLKIKTPDHYHNQHERHWEKDVVVVDAYPILAPSLEFRDVS